MSPKARLAAGVFDLDGVITRTASVHARAWQQTFDDYLERRARAAGKPFQAFDPRADYLRFVDGKPRYEGVRSFFESRGIRLPPGDPSDPPERETICGIGNRKQARFLALVESEGVRVYESTVSLIRRLRSNGVRIAVVTSSRNCAPLLRAAGIVDLFDVSVDGNTLEEQGLRGKPHPDSFLKALEWVGVEPDRALVVEDAVAGVEAGRSGRFALVVGVDRGGNRLALRQAGADLVVSDLDEVSPGQIDAWLENRRLALPSALTCWDEIRQRFEGKRAAVFLDYDGTLTPIVERPDLARLSSDTRAVLTDLSAVAPTIIVSGRGREDVAALVGVDTLVYAGSHGFDISGPGGGRVRHEVGAELLPEVAGAVRELTAALGGISGAQVEDKRFSVAVHYRRVPDDAIGRVESVVDRVLAAHPALRKAHGKKVFELRPRIEWDKGRAVLWLLAALGLEGPEVVPIYLGDDTTDEDAFRALRDRGVAVLVTREPRSTMAGYSLQDPDEVCEFLARLRSIQSPAGPS